MPSWAKGGRWSGGYGYWLLRQRAVTIWMTGLSGSGKSSIAQELERRLHEEGRHVYVLDGEVFWGQDRIELLADALKSGRAPYTSQV